MAQTSVGLIKLSEAMKQFGPRVNRMLTRVLNEHIQIVIEDARQHCPVGVTGKLKASHQVTRAVVSTTGIVSAQVSAGDDDAYYAWIVHEDLAATHPVGEAKWLENAVNRHQQELIDKFDAGAEGLTNALG